MIQHIFRFFERIADRRPPDFIIGGAEQPYMLRWWIIPRNRWLNVYLHHFLRSDDDRALHDHPFASMSVLLDGEYTEHTILAGGINRKIVYGAGDIKVRRAKSFHRVELHNGPCWSLFVTGPRVREWGFACPNGWRHWREFTDSRDKGSIGRGCGE